MATMRFTYEPESFRMIHPLDDVPEKKCSTEGLDKIAMTPSVRISLQILRGYLTLMTLILGYHVLDLPGAFHHKR